VDLQSPLPCQHARPVVILALYSGDMTKTKDVRATFSKVPDKTSLSVFVLLAIEGVGDAPSFGRDRLESAAEQHGRAAASELLEYLKGLPSQAKRDTAEEFVLGYVPHGGSNAADLGEWEGLLAKTFALMLADENVDWFDFGKRLIGLIRTASDFASPRLRAWGSISGS
jgi:hypothetical protein